MKILSLFDGMACGALAFKRADVPIERYVAYEIDKYAIKVSTHNFPMIEQRGDVFQADFTEFEGFDAVIGGSPCTYWSIAQKKDKRETEAHGIGWELFQQYARAIREAKPRFFIYENNKSMAQAIKDEISTTFGFEPIMINSALVSAQNRQRYYWVGIRNEDGTYRKADIDQPVDRGILLKDVIEEGWFTDKDKSHAVIGSMGRTTHREYFMKNQGQMVAGRIVGRRINEDGHRDDYNMDIELQQRFEVNENPQKTNCLTTVQKDNMVAQPIPLNTTNDGKAQCVRATCYKDGIRNMVGNNVDKRTCVAEPVAVDLQVVGRKRNENGEWERSYEARTDGKSSALTSVESRRMVAEPIHVGALPRPNGELSKGQAMQIYSIEGKGKTQMANGGGMGGKTGLYAIPCELLSEEYYKGGFDGDLIGMIENDSVCRNGKQPSQQYRVYSCNGKSVCVDCDQRKHYIVPINETKDGKAHTIKAQYASNSVANFVTNKGFDASGVAVKCDNLTESEKVIYEVKDGLITIKGKQYPIKLEDGFYIIRKLTVTECKRLQTVPDDYDMSVISNTQAYKCLGNGWTVDVIAHLIISVMEELQ